MFSAAPFLKKVRFFRQLHNTFFHANDIFASGMTINFMSRPLAAEAEGQQGQLDPSTLAKLNISPMALHGRK